MTGSRLPLHRPLSRRFFLRSPLLVARDLVGALLIHRRRDGVAGGVIVETEAYAGRRDPGSHAARGPRPGNAPMFGPPGRAYVYKCHLYPLLNAVTGPEGTPGAVLIRALDPAIGLPLMRRRRFGSPGAGGDRDLARGPGRLAMALGVDLTLNRADLLRGPLALRRLARAPAFRVLRSTRIGLRGPAARLPWRFFAAGHPCVSGPAALNRR